MNHARFLIFAVLLAARIATELIINPRIRADAPFRGGEAVSLAVLTMSQAISMAAAGCYLYISTPHSPLLYVVGCSLFAIGFAGRVIGLRALGASYSQKIDPLKHSALVTTGVYSVVRHPLYLFYTIEMAGIFLVRPNYVSLAMLLLELGAVSYRVDREDRALAGTFGDIHAGYRQKTKRFIPYLY
jgi:protein-S-isoprenylcysteine O-methyltransferase Ste14